MKLSFFPCPRPACACVRSFVRPSQERQRRTHRPTDLSSNLPIWRERERASIIQLMEGRSKRVSGKRERVHDWQKRREFHFQFLEMGGRGEGWKSAKVCFSLLDMSGRAISFFPPLQDKSCESPSVRPLQVERELHCAGGSLQMKCYCTAKHGKN